MAFWSCFYWSQTSILYQNMTVNNFCVRVIFVFSSCHFLLCFIFPEKLLKSDPKRFSFISYACSFWLHSSDAVLLNLGFLEAGFCKLFILFRLYLIYFWQNISISLILLPKWSWQIVEHDEGFKTVSIMFLGCLFKGFARTVEKLCVIIDQLDWIFVIQIVARAVEKICVAV